MILLTGPNHPCHIQADDPVKSINNNDSPKPLIMLRARPTQNRSADDGSNTVDRPPLWWHRTRAWLPLSAMVLISAIFASCEQYNPDPWRKQFNKERKIAQQPLELLTKTGAIPQPSEDPAEVLTVVDQQYSSYCASCHGADGKAQSEAALAMNPRPRSFYGLEWQNSVDDAHITKVIKEGGTAVGLSSTMAPWGAVMSDAEIKDMVAKVRSFAENSSQ